jgi:hypothetical protein
LKSRTTHIRAVEITRKDVYKTENDGFIETEIYLYKSGNPKEFKIITPKKYSYDPENQNSKSEYLLEPTKYIKIRYNVSTSFVGKSIQKYKGEDIDCIEYKIELETKYIDLNDSDSKNKKIITKAYYGENIGFMGGNSVSGTDTLKTKLIDIISIKKFEDLKNNS